MVKPSSINKAPHYQVAKRLSGYLQGLKKSWSVVVYDPVTGRRAVGRGIGEAYAKLTAGGKQIKKPVAIEYQAWKKMRDDQKTAH